MVLTCPEYDPATTPKEPVITDLQARLDGWMGGSVHVVGLAGIACA